MFDRTISVVRDHAVRAVSAEAARILDLSAHEGWNSHVLGRAAMPESPIFVGQLWLVPATQDRSVIPLRAMDRLKALYESGVRPRGFVIIHDAPRVLPAPTPGSPTTPEAVDKFNKGLSIPPQIILAAEGALVAIVVLPLVMKLVVAAVSALIAALVVPALVVGLVGAALLVDPALVVVTEDGYWIVIDQWWSSPRGWENHGVAGSERVAPMRHDSPGRTAWIGKSRGWLTYKEG